MDLRSPPASRLNHIERFYPCLNKTSAIWIIRAPETKVVPVSHIDVRALTAYWTLRADFYAGFIRIIGNELAGAYLTYIAHFACGGFPEVIPRIGAATGTSDARFSFHILLFSLRNKMKPWKHYRANENKQKNNQNLMAI
jgi:hypothetical protein